MPPPSRIRVVDSHTEGEPTRVVAEGGPDLGSGTAADRLRSLRARHDAFRTAVVLEPRGHDALVGALLQEPHDPAALAQVLFFNNAGWLAMCVHGTIGVAATLRHLGRAAAGRHRLETPAGDVAFEIASDGRVAVENVHSYRHHLDVDVRTRSFGPIRGDVAWGGNWFFLADTPGLELDLRNLGALTRCAGEIRQALASAGIRGTHGAEIDHVELFGPPRRADADSRNFVLCPGGAYDRSPCGTGTSAKMACLAARGLLEEGRVWRQESLIGSLFEGSIRRAGDGVIPTVTGRAWITGETMLLYDPDDPYREGIRP